MELVSPLLKRRLPFELYCKIEVMTHDLRPVMAELLEKHPLKIPQMMIRTRTLPYVRRLIRRYGEDVNAVSFERRDFGPSPCYFVEVGYTTALHKVRMFRYTRQPRWRGHAWREVGVLL